jgi:hypothetical protein
VREHVGARRPEQLVVAVVDVGRRVAGRELDLGGQVGLRCGNAELQKHQNREMHPSPPGARAEEATSGAFQQCEGHRERARASASVRERASERERARGERDGEGERQRVSKGHTHALKSA